MLLQAEPSHESSNINNNIGPRNQYFKKIIKLASLVLVDSAPSPTMSRQRSKPSASRGGANPRPAYSLYRLQYDLAQLADELPTGIRVFTDDADMYVFVVVVLAVIIIGFADPTQVEILLGPGAARRLPQGLSHPLVGRGSIAMALCPSCRKD